jgi:uncharacterized protein (DUF302 family)
VKTGIKFILLLLTFNVSVCHAVQEYTVKQSRYSVGESMDRLESLIKQNGIIVYSRIYHMIGAKIEGAHLRPAQLIIFGNPRPGSPLMKENPLVALDLPLKVLSWQDENNQTWLAYLNATELQKRHNIQNVALINEIQNSLNALTNKALGYK